MHDDEFVLRQVTEGKLKGLYVFTNDATMEDVAIMGKEKPHQWLTLEANEDQPAQFWKLMTTDGETTISDPTGKWCITRFTKGEKALQLL